MDRRKKCRVNELINANGDGGAQSIGTPEGTFVKRTFSGIVNSS